MTNIYVHVFCLLNSHVRFRMMSNTCRSSTLGRRAFSTILPTGEKVERELSPLEREFVNIKEAEFSKLGLYKKAKTNEATLYRLFQLAQPRNKLDYAACVYAMNHFYNFGIEIDHYDFTNRWLATAIETGRVDEAVQIVKLWNTWLPMPPKIGLVELLIGMVKIQQSRELLKAVRENWQMPMSPTAYTIVISKELASSENDPEAVKEAFAVWEDALMMDVALPSRLHAMLADKLAAGGFSSEAETVSRASIQQALGGIA